jgi:hypothetical protein
MSLRAAGVDISTSTPRFSALPEHRKTMWW